MQVLDMPPDLVPTRLRADQGAAATRRVACRLPLPDEPSIIPTPPPTDQYLPRSLPIM